MIVFGTTFQSNNIKYIKCSCKHLLSHAGAMFLTVLFLAGLDFLCSSIPLLSPIHPMDLRKPKILTGKTKGTLSLC